MKYAYKTLARNLSIHMRVLVHSIAKTVLEHNMNEIVYAAIFQGNCGIIQI